MTKIFKHTNKQRAIMLNNSIKVGVFKYSCPLLINRETLLINKIKTLLIKWTCHLLGYESYKWTTVTIMKKLNWVTVRHIIFVETVIFIYIGQESEI